MKKSGSVLIIGLLISMMLIGIVAAQVTAPKSPIGTNILNFIEETVRVINPLAKYIVGDTTAITVKGQGITAGSLLFAKVLFLIIILAIAYKSLAKIDFFNEQAWVLWIVSIAVSILATRFLGNSLIATIILPYSALGVAVASGLPFVVYFSIINLGFTGIAYKTLRRVAWIFFGVIFIGLWYIRSPALAAGGAGWIYGATGLLAFIMAVMDGTVASFLATSSLDKARSSTKTKLVDSLKRELAQHDSDFGAGIITEAQYRTRVKATRKKIIAAQKIK